MKIFVNTLYIGSPITEPQSSILGPFLYRLANFAVPKARTGLSYLKPVNESFVFDFR
jgi:hypothetical protein